MQLVLIPYTLTMYPAHVANHRLGPANVLLSGRLPSQFARYYFSICSLQNLIVNK